MKAHHYILAIDQGTTTTTALILDLKSEDHRVVSQAAVGFKQFYPKQDWVEHDLEEIWCSCLKAIEKAIKQSEKIDSKFKASSLQAIGLTNQRETLCVFSRKTGAPLYPAIVWQCKRSLKICEELKSSKDLETEIQKKTGLFCDPYFTGTKIKWLIEQDSTLKTKIQSGEALLGTIDSYLLYRLSGCLSFKTEPSNASRTLLYNIKENKWDDSLRKLMGNPALSSLPKVVPSNSLFGKTKKIPSLPDGLPIHGILGDQQAALFGQKCFDYGESKCTYGTGAFMLMQTQGKLIQTQSGLLTTVAWQIDDQLNYALEGSCFIAGAAVGFLRDNLEIIKNVQETDLEEAIEASPHLYFVPSLCGLGAPWWRPEVKGSFLGLTRSTSKKQIMQACLEGICFQVEDLLSVFRKEASFTLKSLFVDGGACANKRLMETQAYLSNLSLTRPKILETTAYGAALMSAHGCGLIPDLNKLKKIENFDRVFSVTKDKDLSSLRKEKLFKWQRAVEALKMFHNYQEDST